MLLRETLSIHRMINITYVLVQFPEVCLPLFCKFIVQYKRKFLSIIIEKSDNYLFSLVTEVLRSGK